MPTFSPLSTSLPQPHDRTCPSPYLNLTTPEKPQGERDLNESQGGSLDQLLRRTATSRLIVPQHIARASFFSASPFLCFVEGFENRIRYLPQSTEGYVCCVCDSCVSKGVDFVCVCVLVCAVHIHVYAFCAVYGIPFPLSMEKGRCKGWRTDGAAGMEPNHCFLFSLSAAFLV